MTLNALIEKIIAFSEKINGFRFRPYQQRRVAQFLAAVLTQEVGTFTNLWARKTGKTETLKALTLSLMALLPELAKTNVVYDFPALKKYRDGFTVAIAGPKGYTAALPFKRLRRQARTRRFHDALEELGLRVEASNSEVFELSNFSLAQAFSGSETASNEGPDASLLIVEEAQLVSSFSYYKILRPMVADAGGLIINSGTPGRKRCAFLNEIEYNLRENRELHQAVPWHEAAKYSETYRKFVEGEIKRLPGGEENPYFRMNYLLEWHLMASHFVDANHFLSLRKGTRGTFSGPLFAGIDWGKASSKTAVVILAREDDRAKVVDLLSLSGDYNEQFAYLIPFLQKYIAKGLVRIVSETNAAGDPNTEKLRTLLGKNRVEGIYTCPTTKDRVFTNLKTEIDGGRFIYFQDHSPEALTFEREFLEAEQEVKGDLLKVHKPDEEGASDDFLVATALALHALLRTPANFVSGVTSGRKRVTYRELSDY